MTSFAFYLGGALLYFHPQYIFNLLQLLQLIIFGWHKSNYRCALLAIEVLLFF